MYKPALHGETKGLSHALDTREACRGNLSNVIQKGVRIRLNPSNHVLEIKVGKPSLAKGLSISQGTPQNDNPCLPRSPKVGFY